MILATNKEYLYFNLIIINYFQIFGNIKGKNVETSLELVKMMLKDKCFALKNGWKYVLMDFFQDMKYIPGILEIGIELIT